MEKQDKYFNDIKAKCMDCGNTYIITGKEQRFANDNNKYELPKRCKACRDIRRNAIKNIKCKTCGTEFEFGANEQDYFKKHNLEDPVHCHTCRTAKKLVTHNV